MVEIGSAVTYVDPRGKEHNALVTQVWGPNCINVVFMNADENQRDDYGRKTQRMSSLMHQSVQEAHGNYWK